MGLNYFGFACLWGCILAGLNTYCVDFLLCWIIVVLNFLWGWIFVGLNVCWVGFCGVALLWGLILVVLNSWGGVVFLRGLFFVVLDSGGVEFML